MTEFRPQISDAARQTLLTVSQEIRPFPATATKIMDLCRDANSNIMDIVQLIECEPAIASKLLEMTNSPLYGVTREVTTVSSAVVLLGAKTVSKMALSIATGPLFLSGEEAVSNHRKKIFRESLGTATACRLLADEGDDIDPDEAFLAGVIHDVGKLFFLDVVPTAYIQLLEAIKSGETTGFEKQAFGTDHSTVGQKCGERWGLPSSLTDAIENHHGSFSDIESELTQMVIAGNYFARQWQLGFHEDEVGDRNSSIEEAFSALELADLATQASEEFQVIEEICLS